MRLLPIPISSDAISDFCRKWNVAELSLFGSVLNDAFRSDSDIDVLVRFQEGTTLTLDSYTAMRDELSSLLGGRQIDLVEEGRLTNPYRRHEILRTRETLYVR